jgi:hypothetical protein
MVHSVLGKPVMKNIKTGVNSILIGKFLPPQGTNNFSIAVEGSLYL